MRQVRSGVRGSDDVPRLDKAVATPWPPAEHTLTGSFAPARTVGAEPAFGVVPRELARTRLQSAREDHPSDLGANGRAPELLAWFGQGHEGRYDCWSRRHPAPFQPLGWEYLPPPRPDMGGAGVKIYFRSSTLGMVRRKLVPAGRVWARTVMFSFRTLVTGVVPEGTDRYPSVVDRAVVDGSGDEGYAAADVVLMGELAAQPYAVHPAELVRGLITVAPVEGSSGSESSRIPVRNRICRTQQWIERDGSRWKPLVFQGDLAAAERAMCAYERAS
jgi:hypothetical protein